MKFDEKLFYENEDLERRNLLDNKNLSLTHHSMNEENSFQSK